VAATQTFAPGGKYPHATTGQDKLKIQTIQLNTTQKRQTTQNTAKQNYPGLAAFYDTWPGNSTMLLSPHGAVIAKNDSYMEYGKRYDLILQLQCNTLKPMAQVYHLLLTAAYNDH